MIDEQGQAQLSCHFCNKAYTFDKAELEQLHPIHPAGMIAA